MINKLKDEVENVISGETNIRIHILSHFKDLFTTSHMCSSNSHFAFINNANVLSEINRITLDSLIRDTEIIVALKSFKPLKSPGPDGFHPTFFQKFYSIVGPSTIDFCKKVLTSYSMPPDNNATLICLIPKCSNAETLKSFRPIGLCNTSYKLITKIIVNIIKP